MSYTIAGMGEVLWDMLPTGRQCGGAPANVIYHVNRQGGCGYIISSIGVDEDGDALEAFLKSKGLDCRFLTRNDLPTGLVTVSLQDGIPSYDIHQPSAWDNILLTAELLECCRSFDAFVFGSLAQRDSRTRNALFQVIRNLPEKCLKVFDINLRQAFYDEDIIRASLNAADVLKLNDEECAVMAKMFNMPGTQDETVSRLASEFNLRYVILTLGANGSAIYDGNGPMRRYPIVPCPKLVDTVGCGDSFLAAWLLATLEGATQEQAMLRASELSAFVAGSHGAMP